MGVPPGSAMPDTEEEPKHVACTADHCSESLRSECPANVRSVPKASQQRMAAMRGQGRTQGRPQPSMPGGIYHTGMMGKRGQHLFASFDERFFVLAVKGTRGCLRWYSSQADYGAGREEKGQIWTDEILDVKTNDTHPREVDQGGLWIVLDDDTRELRTDNPPVALAWLKQFAIERVDRGYISRRSVAPPGGNEGWKKFADARENQWKDYQATERANSSRVNGSSTPPDHFPAAAETGRPRRVPTQAPASSDNRRVSPPPSHPQQMCNPYEDQAHSQQNARLNATLQNQAQPVFQRSYSVLCADEAGVPLEVMKEVLAIEGRDESIKPQVLSAAQRIHAQRATMQVPMHTNAQVVQVRSARRNSHKASAPSSQPQHAQMQNRYQVQDYSQDNVRLNATPQNHVHAAAEYYAAPVRSSDPHQQFNPRTAIPILRHTNSSIREGRRFQGQRRVINEDF